MSVKTKVKSIYELKLERVVIDYTNHEGIREERLIDPIGITFMEAPGDTDPQWVLQARALDRDGKFRLFAMKDIHSWRPALT